MTISKVTWPMGFVRVPFIALIVALVGTMLPFGRVCQALNDMKLWLMPGSSNASNPNVVALVIFRVKGILVKIVGEKEGVSLVAFSHTQWGNTHKGGG